MGLEDDIRKELRAQEAAKAAERQRQTEEKERRRNLLQELRTIAQEMGLEKAIGDVGRTFLGMRHTSSYAMDTWIEDDEPYHPGIIMYVYDQKTFSGYTTRYGGGDLFGGYYQEPYTLYSYSMLGVELHHSFYKKTDEHSGSVFLAIGATKKIRTRYDINGPDSSGGGMSFDISRGDLTTSRASFDHEITKLIGFYKDYYQSWKR